MPDDDDLTSLLACPRCDRAPLEPTDAGLRCNGCHVDFPSIDGLPWLFADPAAALAAWRGRLHFSLRKLDEDGRRLEKAMREKGLTELTRHRLDTLMAATADHAQRLRALLAPLEVDALAATYETYLALRTRLPSDQGLMTYYNNVHRDWCWGDEENEASFAIVDAALAGRPPGKVLVLGAGAGRLAYDLHERWAASTTVVLDFNPLLLMLAQRLTRGESVELYEFPLAPIDIEHQAILRKLEADHAARPGLVYVLADAHRPPFRDAGFDTIVTPWLIDILPEPFPQLCARFNALLAEGGRWINFGSLNFHAADPALRFSREECAEIVARTGFAEPELREDTIPYMCSPASRHGRRERVLSFSAAKVKQAKRAPRYEALPDWLVRGKDPVPALETFRVQAAATRIHAFIMSLIDGHRSIKDMAALFAEQKLMPSEEAEAAIRQFLIKMHEDSRRGYF